MIGTAIFHTSNVQHHPCEIFNCTNRRKWVICAGDNTHISHLGFHICNECALNIIGNLPEGMTAEDRDIRAELEAKYNEKLLELEAIHAKEMGDAINIGRREAKANEAVTIVEPLPFEVDPEEEKPVNEGIFRCLDCDKEFDNKRALSNHMRIHESK